MNNYILESVTLLQDGAQRKLDIHIKDNHIFTMYSPVNKIRLHRTYLHDYYMAPTFVCIDPHFTNVDENHIHDYVSETFIKKGITTVVIPVPIQYEFEFTQQIHYYRKALQKLSLDYLLVAEIPQKCLTANVLRKCASLKIPAIVLKLEDQHLFSSIHWGWEVQSVFPYNPVFIPHFIQGKTESWQQLWTSVMNKLKIAHFEDLKTNADPLNLVQLKQMGIYPFKGIIRTDGEVSYNLFLKNNYDKNLSLIENKPAITVWKGKVLRCKDVIYETNQVGEELIVQRPGFFSAL